MKEPATIILMGKSGAGKGTQASLLADSLHKESPEYQVLKLETGQNFRNFISGPSHSASTAKSLMESGILQPAFLAIWNWSSALIDQFSGTEHLILDGIARTLIEAEALDTALKFYKRPNACIVHINITDEEATRRLLERGRADDTESDIKSRLEWFKRDVVPAVDYFRAGGVYKFIEVDGEQEVEAVHQDIIKQLA
jgi:adenylate kinase